MKITQSQHGEVWLDFGMDFGVGFWNGPVGLPQGELLTVCSSSQRLRVRRIYDVYFEKIRVFKASYLLNT